MRLLTPQEQRELEVLRRSLYSTNASIEVCDSNREMWLNILEMVLSTQEAMKTAWYRRGNKRIDTIQAVEYKRGDNE